MIHNLSFSRQLVRSSLTLLVIGAIHFLIAAGAPIGIAVANGSFQVDHSKVWGNTTLFNGSIIETALTPSQLQLTGGVHMRLASDTRATVYQHKLVLESGYGQLESGTAFEIEARSLHISAASSSTVARVRLTDKTKVMVAALTGAVQVRSSSGLLVANVEAGSSLDFEPQAEGAAAATRISGCVLSKAGKVIVVEQTTNVMLELQGTGLEKLIGNHVEITGMDAGTKPTVSGASQAIRVVGLKQISKGGCSAIARKAGASAAAGAAASAAAAGSSGGGGAAASAGAATAAGIGTGTIAVIGGVAAAATIGSLAAVGELPGQSSSPPSASR
jgi:hypothetical protein